MHASVAHARAAMAVLGRVPANLANEGEALGLAAASAAVQARESLGVACEHELANALSNATVLRL